MERALRWEFKGQTLWMFPEKVLYWEEERMLLVADLHIGKVGHFRKAGIAIPRPLAQEELAILSDLIYRIDPLKLVFLGDLFHSELNNDWNWLGLWRELHPALDITLIKGNHDILHDDLYAAARFEVLESLNVGPFTFVHEAEDAQLYDGQYIISGHIHPGVKLRGKARQSIVLPCFYFGRGYALMPAFGSFTGTYCIQVEESSAVFGILKGGVRELSS